MSEYERDEEVEKKLPPAPPAHPRHWKNQPKACEGCPVRFSAFFHGSSVEVREESSGTSWLVTVGNLFGSQTVRVRTTADLLYTLQLAAREERPEGGFNRPKAIELLKNDGEPPTHPWDEEDDL